MSDPTAPVEGAPISSTPEAAPAPDPYAPVLDRMGELANNMEARFGALEARLPQPQQEPEPNPWAGLFPEEEPEPQQYQPEPQLDPAALQNAFQQALQQANAPLMQQVQQMQAERAREQLLQEIPALKDPAVAQQTVTSMVESLRQANASPEFIDWALQNPQQIALHFKAAEATKLAAGQAPAPSAVPNVESAGGAVPGGNGESLNPVHEIFGARAGGLPKGFG
jgi:hypothetical protein